MQQGYYPNQQNQQPSQRRRRYQAPAEPEAAAVQQPMQYHQQPYQPAQSQREQPVKSGKVRRSKAAKPKKKKWLIAMIVLAVVFVLGSLPGPKGNSPAHQIALDAYRDHLISFDESTSERGSITIKYDLVTGWSNESTQTSFWYESYETIKNLWELKQQGETDFYSIRITAMAEYKDAYGNVTKDRAIDMAVNTDFLAKINWEVFNSEDLERLAGAEFSYFCHPEFQ